MLAWSGSEVSSHKVNLCALDLVDRLLIIGNSALSKLSTLVICLGLDVSAAQFKELLDQPTDGKVNLLHFGLVQHLNDRFLHVAIAQVQPNDLNVLQRDQEARLRDSFLRHAGRTRMEFGFTLSYSQSSSFVAPPHNGALTRSRIGDRR